MYSIVRNFNGHFEVEEHFDEFQKAADYMYEAGAWGRWLVTDSTAAMLNEKGVSDLDTPNFKHFGPDGRTMWYADPVYRAKLLFEQLTGLEFKTVKTDKSLLPLIEGTDLEADIEDLGNGVVAVNVYYGGVEAYLCLETYPEFFRVFWADDTGVSSSPPNPIPSPEFFRAFLGLP